MPISDTCYHVEVSPGQMCGCLDLLMWTRLLVELQARRITELETTAQRGTPQLLLRERRPGCCDVDCDECAELRT